MNPKVPRLINGGTPGLTILAFMGMTGGAYYLYKQKGAKNPPRIPDSSPDSIAKKEQNKPGEVDTKCQDLGFDGTYYPLMAAQNQKDLTEPAPTKDSSEKLPKFV